MIRIDAASVEVTIDGHPFPRGMRFATEPEWWESRARIVRKKHRKRKPPTPFKQRAKRR